MTRRRAARAAAEARARALETPEEREDRRARVAAEEDRRALESDWAAVWADFRGVVGDR